MSELADYAEAYDNLKMRRDGSILELRLHTDDGPLRWGSGVKRIADAFAQVARDPQNSVVILTGTGDAFVGDWDRREHAKTPEEWDVVYRDGIRLLTSLLEIGIPTIAAVNGPVRVHAEIALLCDIVIASTDTVFTDEPHFRDGITPGDGAHIVWPLLLGPNRARYLLLTGQALTAREACDLGIVGEVVARAELLDRAWAIARDLARRPRLALRYAHEVLTLDLRRHMHEHLGYGLALEGLGAVQLRGWRMADGGAPPEWE